MDFSEEAVDSGEILPEPDSFDLGEGSLNVTAEALEDCLLYTNTTEITVRVSAEPPAACTVYLCADGADLMQFTLDAGEREKTFTNLTAARRYTLRAENAAGLTFTVTD